ncbi:MAG: chorismate mutase [Clostridia bacterium]
MSEEIQSLRQQINEVDEQLAELFDRRMTISKGVALYKKEHNLPIFDKEREQQVFSPGLWKPTPTGTKRFTSPWSHFFRRSWISARRARSSGSPTRWRLATTGARFLFQ